MMKKIIAKSLLACAGIAGLFAAPSAFARDHWYSSGVFIRGESRDCGPRRIWIEPVYEERSTRIWVPAQYRTVCEEVPVAAVYRTVCDRVWVEPVYETRRVWTTDRWGRRVEVIDRVCVRPGGFRNVDRQVLVSPARCERVERQVLVTEAHWETRCERVAVRPGCWETVSYGHPRYSSGIAVSFNFR